MAVSVNIGDKFGRWTVIGVAEPGRKGAKYWLCECSCQSHTVKRVSQDSLRRGTSKSCGCISRELATGKTPWNKKHEDVVVGNVYGKWKVIEESSKRGKSNNQRYWLCECGCTEHTVREVMEESLLKGTSVSCGCVQKDAARNGAEKNRKYPLAKKGDQFNRWIVIDDTVVIKNRKASFLCQCSCWRKTTTYISNYELHAGISKGCKHCARFKDISGQTFEYLTALYIDENMSKKLNMPCYVCYCKCGKLHSVRAQCLVNGTTTSCGCKKDEIEDLTGQTFGDLTVVSFSHKKHFQGYNTSINMWNVVCSCGKKLKVGQGNLKSGNSLSCGCHKETRGEKAIKDYLDIRGIPYETQYTLSGFSNLKYGAYRFDFGVLNKESDLLCLIEYDGEGHYHPIDFAGKGKEWADDQFRQYKERDRIKTEYCRNNKIPLIRIPYWDFSIIESILDGKLKEVV